MSNTRLIVGLGNPGEQYAQTRHNVGAWLIHKFAEQTNIVLNYETKFHGQIGRLELNQQTCWLFIPTTFMNESGRAVSAVAKYYKIAAEMILVAHDELDFPAGMVRFKENGGHGGHNGLRDIINQLQTNQFNRIRIGIDHPGHKDQVTSYVLSKPSAQDRIKILTAIEDAISILPDWISGDTQKAFRYLHNIDKV